MGIVVINVEFGETRVALVEKGQVAEVLYERTIGKTVVGNVYLGKVTRVLAGLQAAFVDIGQPRAAFLHVQDLLHTDEDKPPSHKQDATAVSSRVSRETPITQVIREGQSLVVQVVKDAMGTKGARVTSRVTLAGRYLVYTPSASNVGVSKRMGTGEQRDRVRAIVESHREGTGGWIVRTAAMDITDEQIHSDMQYLKRLWQQIEKKRGEHAKAPALLYSELDLVLRAARDLVDDNVQQVIIDSTEDFERLHAFVATFMPQYSARLQLFQGTESVFEAYGIEEEIARALGRKVALASGGYLVIDEAEALTAIDVNTGSFVGTDSKDMQAAVMATNLEAIDEIAYQLRLRNLGGLIVIDLIDMNDPHDRDLVLQRLKSRMQSDRTHTSIHPVSELGLIEMTRKRTRDSLSKVLHEPCFYCDGTGHVQSRHTVAIDVLRQLRRESQFIGGTSIVVSAHPVVIQVLQHDQRQALDKVMRTICKRVELVANEYYHIEQFDLQGK